MDLDRAIDSVFEKTWQDLDSIMDTYKVDLISATDILHLRLNECWSQAHEKELVSAIQAGNKINIYEWVEKLEANESF